MDHSLSRTTWWYYAALLYFTGMALTGFWVRYQTPENSANQEKYMQYMFVLSVFWPVTLVAMATNQGDGF